MKSRVWKKRAPCYGVLVSFGPHATGRWQVSAHVPRVAGMFCPSCYGKPACSALRAIVGAAAGRAWATIAPRAPSGHMSRWSGKCYTFAAHMNYENC